MLYDLHELQRAFLSPFVAFTDTSSRLFTDPYNPLSYTPMARSIAATYDLVHRLGKDYEKPAWGLSCTQVDGATVPVTENVVANLPFCRLVHFRRQLPEGRTPDPRILLVAPLSGHHATLLRDTVRTLLPRHEVFVTDWVDARMVEQNAGCFGLNDYIHYVQTFIRHLDGNAHVMAVCQPTAPVLAAIALMASNDEPCLPRSMIMMGGPIDARQSPTQVNRLAMNKPYSWFENNLIDRVPGRFPGMGRRVYPGFLQHAGFVAMNPDRHLQSHYDYFLSLLQGDGQDAEAHRRFYDEYNAVLDMPAEFYLDTIRIVFQEYELARGGLRVNGQRVDPTAIRNVALFTIEGELDDISGQGQTQAAHALCTAIPDELRQHYTAPDCGHYGIFAGRRWRELICPRIENFIRHVA
ncbi:MAG: polyhydroxyalkanoate depolymerase [Castellaniella sp.]